MKLPLLALAKSAIRRNNRCPLSWAEVARCCRVFIGPPHEVSPWTVHRTPVPPTRPIGLHGRPFGFAETSQARGDLIRQNEYPNAFRRGHLPIFTFETQC